MRVSTRCRRILFAAALALSLAHGLRLARSHRAAERLPARLTGRIVELGQVTLDHAVDPPPAATLAAGALAGLAWGADDPYTRVLDDRALAAHASTVAGQYGGLGVVIGHEARSTLVEVVHAHGPAAAAGLLPGDRICAVDGQPTAGVDPPDLRELLRGAPGSRVALDVWRDAEARSFVRVATRALVHLPSAVRAGWLDRSRGIATIALVLFQDGTGEECARALAALERDTALRGLALDLRGNPGGLVGEARQVAGLFADGLVLATIARRRTARDTIAIATPTGPRWLAVPLAVLIDRDTASAAEILTLALQDHRRALVVGERSFGKAAIQDTVRLAGGGALKLSIARYLGPSGAEIHKRPATRGGIVPDLPVPTGATDRARLADGWRDRAIADSGVFAPGWTPREMPDPVLDAARAALAGERVVVRITGE